jgi:hypothetical protein
MRLPIGVRPAKDPDIPRTQDRGSRQALNMTGGQEISTFRKSIRIGGLFFSSDEE